MAKTAAMEPHDALKLDTSEQRGRTEHEWYTCERCGSRWEREFIGGERLRARMGIWALQLG
jgi:hypothetical protein